MKSINIKVLIISTIIPLLISCKNGNDDVKLFEKLSNTQTRVDFKNDLVEKKGFGILDYLYFYNGAE